MKFAVRFVAISTLALCSGAAVNAAGDKLINTSMIVVQEDCCFPPCPPICPEPPSGPGANLGK